MITSMGDFGAALSFSAYANALDRFAAMQPADFAQSKMMVLYGLAGGALLLFLLMIVRRSGTAAAGFALTALYALCMAMLFGSLDFLTPGTKMLVVSLTASAFVLFVNAVLHTGRENIVIASFSALVIGVLLALGGSVAIGMDFASPAKLAVAAASVFAAFVLIFGIMGASGGRVFLAIAVLVALVSSGLMLNHVTPKVAAQSSITMLPVMAASFSVLIACLMAPFLADELTVGGMSSGDVEPGPLFQSFDESKMGVALAAGGAVGTAAALSSGAADDEPLEQALGDLAAGSEPYGSEPPLFASPQGSGEQADTASELPFAEVQSGLSANAEPLRGNEGFADRFDPVSSHWGAATAAAGLDAAADEYVWDALADVEVRCGSQVLDAFGAQGPSALTPEGMRDVLDPSVLAMFDQEVLGGSDPVSGSFDIALATGAYQFRFAGRRQVDHEGVLMRIDGTVRDVVAAPPTQNLAGGTAGISAPLDLDLPSVARLSDKKGIGFDATPQKRLADAAAVKAHIEAAGRSLAELVSANSAGGPFAVIDASATGHGFGVVLGAVAKAIRVHELPKGAFLVGLDLQAVKSPRALIRAAEDIRSAGAGLALIFRDASDKAGKVRPDMVLIDAHDAHLGRRLRRPLVESLARRYRVPVLIRGLHEDDDAERAASHGAVFGTGRAFGNLAVEPVAPSQTPSPSDQSAPTGSPSGLSLRARGLR